MARILSLLLFTTAAANGASLGSRRKGIVKDGILNDRPIIGILAQESVDDLYKPLMPQYANTTMIAASYVKWVEGSGARAVPIFINQPAAYYTDLLSKINGVLLPGGAVSLRSSGYANASDVIYSYAVERNTKGDYFPIWATCLGFEMLSIMAARGKSWLSNCTVLNESLPLLFEDDYNTSRLFRNAPKWLIRSLANKPTTANFHHFCLTKDGFDKAELADELRLISTSQDRVDGQMFVSTVEGKYFPFYGVQFHPEKNNYEWHMYYDIPHDQEAVEISQYFANFFVSEARRNFHTFTNKTEEDRRLIYNWSPIKGIGTPFTQVYIFE